MIYKNKVYADADNKFVKSTIVYVDTDANKLYHDPEKTLKVYNDELEELFLNKMIVFMGNFEGLEQYYALPGYCNVERHFVSVSGYYYYAHERSVEE